MEREVKFKWRFPSVYDYANYKCYHEELMNAIKYVTDDFIDTSKTGFAEEQGFVIVNEECGPYVVEFSSLTQLKKEILEDMSYNCYEYPDDESEYSEITVRTRGLDETCNFEIRSKNGFCGKDYVVLVVFKHKT